MNFFKKNYFISAVLFSIFLFVFFASNAFAAYKMSDYFPKVTLNKQAQIRYMKYTKGSALLKTLYVNFVLHATQHYANAYGDYYTLYDTPDNASPYYSYYWDTLFLTVNTTNGEVFEFADAGTTFGNYLSTGFTWGDTMNIGEVRYGDDSRCYHESCKGNRIQLVNHYDSMVVFGKTYLDVVELVEWQNALGGFYTRTFSARDIGWIREEWSTNNSWADPDLGSRSIHHFCVIPGAQWNTYNNANVDYCPKTPTVSISAPANNSTVSGKVDIIANTSNATNVTVSKVEFYDVNSAGGVKLLGTVSASPYIYSWDTSSASIGKHVIIVKAYDTANVLLGQDQVEVNIEVNIPEVDLKINGADATSTIPYKYNVSTTINLSWTTKNADSCSASGGWSGSKTSSGSESITRVFTTSTVFTLTCKNNKNPDKTGSDSVALEVQRGADDAAIINNTIPLNMEAGKRYDGSITVKNTGANTWTKSAGYALKALGDAIYFLENSEFVLNDNENIATDQDKTFNFAMTALTASGTYKFVFTMKNGNGLQFGEQLSKNVEISPIPKCSPSQVNYGTVAPYPDCRITCNSGYVLSGNSCVISSVSYEQKIKDIEAQIQNAQQSLSVLTSLLLANPNDQNTLEAIKTVAEHIADLNSQLNELKSQTPITVFSFTRNLYLGSQGNDVKKLQEFLAKDKTIYPEGKITGYFGLLTKKAVQRFQCKYNIVCSGAPYSTGYGAVGPKTREKLNVLMGLKED